jgi:hypothetical protein
MKNTYYIIIGLLFIFLGVSCSVRYRTFSKAAEKLINGSIKREKYDSIINTFYITTMTDFKLNSKIKLEGSYLCTEYSDYYKKNDYRILKFTDSSIVFKSYRFYEPTNNVLAKTEGTIYRYNTKENELVLEYLLSRDFELYNILKYARISKTGDSLIFYKTEVSQRPNEKKLNEKEEIYIYHSSLTALPILPNKSTPPTQPPTPQLAPKTPPTKTP